MEGGEREEECLLEGLVSTSWTNQLHLIPLWNQLYIRRQIYTPVFHNKPIPLPPPSLSTKLWHSTISFCSISCFVVYSSLISLRSTTVFFKQLSVQKRNLSRQQAEFLDEIQTKVLKVFLRAIHSHLYSFALRFLFLQTHATSYIFYCSVTAYTVHIFFSF